MWWVWASSEQKVYLQKFNVTLSVGDDSKAFLGYSIAATIGTVSNLATSCYVATKCYLATTG